LQVGNFVNFLVVETEASLSGKDIAVSQGYEGILAFTLSGQIQSGNHSSVTFFASLRFSLPRTLQVHEHYTALFGAQQHKDIFHGGNAIGRLVVAPNSSRGVASSQVEGIVVTLEGKLIGENLAHEVSELSQGKLGRISEFVVVDNVRTVVRKASDGARNVVFASILVNTALAQAELSFTKNIVNTKDVVTHHDLVRRDGTKFKISRDRDGTIIRGNGEECLTVMTNVEPVAAVCLGKSHQEGTN